MGGHDAGFLTLWETLGRVRLPPRNDLSALLASTLRPAGASTVSPTFTVIMPTFNRANVLLEAVESVLSQSNPDLEFVVVDDHSTDDTRARLATIVDPRMRVVMNTRSKGVAGARNCGVDLAVGEWICQIDSDDIWPSDMLERLAVAIEGAPAEVGVVYGSLAFVSAKTGVVRRIRRAEMAGNVHTAFLEHHFICHCAAAIRTEALRGIRGYDEAFAAKSDTDMLLRLTERYDVIPVPDLLYTYRVGSADQVTGDKRAFLDAYLQYIRKHAGLLAQHPRARYQLLANVLRLAANAGDWKRAGLSWIALAPALWRAPRVFVTGHRGLAVVAIGHAKRRILRWRGRAGSHARPT